MEEKVLFVCVNLKSRESLKRSPRYALDEIWSSFLVQCPFPAVGQSLLALPALDRRQPTRRPGYVAGKRKKRGKNTQLVGDAQIISPLQIIEKLLVIRGQRDKEFFFFFSSCSCFGVLIQFFA